MIRILHVLGGLNRGGAETMVMNLYRNIDRSKVQFDFIIHTKNKCDYDNEIRSLGGRIYNVPKYKGINHLEYEKSWSDFFKNHSEYKIIHGHVRSTASIYLKIAKEYGIKTISHSHSTSSGKGFSALVKNILQYQIRYTADYLFACSKSAGVWLFGKKACKNDKFFILNNAIDSKKFIFNKNIRENKRIELQISDKFVIGHVGRFNTAKNHNYLIDIFKEVKNINNNAVLMLVGEGELKGVIQNKVKSMGLSDSVIFTGVRDDIPDLLQAMDVFVFPSIFEGLGIVAVEAQAAGIPSIVANTIPGEAFITDLIKSLSLNESVEIWAKTILKYADGYERRSTYKEIVDSGYDIHNTANWLEDFYLNERENM